MKRIFFLAITFLPWASLFAVPEQLDSKALKYLGANQIQGPSPFPKMGNSFRNGELLAQAGNLPSSGLTRTEKKDNKNADGEEEEEEELPSFYDNRKPEIGFWIGASNPMPGSDAQKYLDTTLGGGLFYRIPWPWIFYLEFGGSYSNYLSRSERALTTIPVYGALCYKLPLEIPITFIVKAGGGETYVVARPANTARWDKSLFAGLEASFIAGKKIRIGIRLDYNKIYESDLEAPAETKYPYLGPSVDPRLSNPYYYNKVDTEFFHFGLMVSLFL
ncbi:hypothetical protein EHQ27_01885 [Leptospira wolffii]|uniref:Outer membrane protein beta-barrel domain-containing protein n=1 Tax=Leptospira wolffii TaxID=409998 RepID=A0A2M9ZB91_9LEPT|nr:hypothetical protein [Leptospira wolffii]EPG67356.1 hypothetical protein LEP1GSC061_1371 [Leptospira wolffii serovar Khorat str. Khorat-H2]PJZ65693.1 hypothetical protein CH371_12265 [Leptospira wolffii]TGK56091.1 hypothetical protein EHQ32_16905 [Leptospira wolffii]TGK72137.1 hypothetical protein EHQ35_12340 [Leptospira wolffii]TGK77441.1 hypothetical protein EHQ27_01885 [Leptospira wolffii]